MYRINFDQPPLLSLHISSPYPHHSTFPVSCDLKQKKTTTTEKPQSPLSVHECRTTYCCMGDISGVVTLKKTSPEVVVYEQGLSRQWNIMSPLPDSCWALGWLDLVQIFCLQSQLP